MTNNDIKNMIENHAEFKSELAIIEKILEDSSVWRNKKIEVTDTFIKQSILKSFELDKFVETHMEVLQENLMYSHKFNSALMSAFFLTYFSLFETYLKRIVELTDKIAKINSPLDINNIKTGIVNTLLDHLFNKHNIRCANTKKASFKEINIFRLIRNAVAHNDSKLYKKDIDQCLPKLKKHNANCSLDNCTIKIEQISFLKEFHKLTYDYGTKINREIISKYQ